ncbi:MULTISPECIES: response regulator transcription factor [Sporomusa]|jgi:DNA-binding response OmpR family regulator|uniref:Transcriptional regulatory protein SrrA n=1 Tax=Sporomusa silvacetica DSM 10669 TaxID=1123289 RepID=A0ABZ3IH07_9FIRM|nr:MULTISPECIES: response regulator transcription factor [Sporomusa]OZC16507.1 transcriptional regulatory protein SrrA [Sporomusa silvacetica DSM 10669]TWH47375.1 DNA-binding response OmpR family regulator [Sporomusa sp. KB1]
MAKTVLLVDDELRMRKLVADFLLREGYHILEAANGQMALHLLSVEKIDLVILDVMMPERNGWTVCQAIRKNGTIPVIMLTAKSEEADQLYAFEIGADEYVTKPFSPKVLTARVNALFRRMEQEKDKTALCGGLVIDTAARQVFLDEQLLDLSPKEYELLNYLAENTGNALSRPQILDHVWTYDYLGELRTVDTHINRLRTKLGAKSTLIHTIRGYGYRFEAEK